MKNKKIYIIIFLLILFIINTILVITNNTTTIDNFIHSNVILMFSETTTKIMKVFTFFGSTIGIIGIAALLFFFFLIKKDYNKSFSIVGIVGMATIINTVIKHLVRRARPEYITVIEKSFSYPSGHTIASTTLYGFLIYLIIKSKMPKVDKIIFSTLLSILILLVATSRIYLGAHFFSDVFGAFLLGIILILTYSVIFDDYKVKLFKGKK